MPVDLTTKLGTLELKSPIIVGSCPMTTDENLRIAMSDNRVGAIVLPSVAPASLAADEEYFQKVQRASASGIPVFASLRVPITDDGSMFKFASKLESSGVSAIEISVQRTGICKNTDPRSIEDDLVGLIQKADECIDIPLFVKLTSNFTSISHLAKRLKPSAQGLIMFGKSPVVDIELDNIQLSNKWGLTQPGSVATSIESLMRTRIEYPNMSLIACGGIGSSTDMIKALMAGANAVMVTSAIYREGIAILGSMNEGLLKYMSDRGLENLPQLQALCPQFSEQDCPAAPEEGGIRRADVGTDSPIENQIRCDRYGHPETTADTE